MTPSAHRGIRGLVRRPGTILAVVVAVLALLPFGLAPYALSVVALGLVYGLFAYGLDLSWGRVGLISVGQAAFFGLGAYALTIGVSLGVPGVLAAALGVVISAGVAGLIAQIALTVKGETAVPLFILFTLGISQLLQRVATSLPDVTGGSNGMLAPRLDLVPTYYLVLGVAVLVAALTFRLFIAGRRGAFQLAVLVNPARAEHLGIGVRGTQTAAFMVSAAVSAVAGALFAPVAGLVTPATLGLALSTSVLTWLAVGGKGSLIGPFLGAVLLTVAAQTLGSTWQSWYVFGLAALFILVVLFAPGGVAGGVRRLLLGRSEVLRVPTARPVRRAGAPSRTDAPLLQVEAVDQRFGRSDVLQDVSLTVRSGQCVALIGPNGAGKSTVLSVIAGLLRPSSGRILLRGEDVTLLGVDRRARLGIGRLFQVPSVFTALSVEDNLRLAALCGGSGDDASADARLAGELSMAERRHLELDMVLRGPSDLVLLDEPAAGLSHADARALAQRLRRVVEDTGCGMVVVEHDMEIVREIADLVVVLSNGAVIASGTMDEIVAHDAVRQAYLGS
ncbi:ATP-binding cassette domain-containing protein [Microbacterium sp. NPDC089698]|uniref:branched-chain amino acid ABC transporter ATP-binding protein/permease n=1 Tax=Microbacterium sp. NPDC089698 TaxID=3364200 RepID=UPI0038185D41